MRLCVQEHHAMRASMTHAIRFFHARQGDVPAAVRGALFLAPPPQPHPSHHTQHAQPNFQSRQLARHLLWRAERNMQLEARQAAALVGGAAAGVAGAGAAEDEAADGSVGLSVEEARSSHIPRYGPGVEGSGVGHRASRSNPATPIASLPVSVVFRCLSNLSPSPRTCAVSTVEEPSWRRAHSKPRAVTN